MLHLATDLLAMLVGSAFGFWLRRRFGMVHIGGAKVLTGDERATYLAAAIVGVVLGAISLGSANAYLTQGVHSLVIAKSVLGGIAGASLAIEIWKHVHNVRHSTGFFFVPALAMSIALGRIGCFLAGLHDMTHGIASDLPWAVDLGDGISRHPVQLYESAAMLLFLMVCVASLRRHLAFWRSFGWASFVFFYSAQRFVWEFLKPYARILGPFNLFHLVCLAMMVYAVGLVLSTTAREASHV